ncbi:serine-rich adhesin for platelets-like, partial [Octopus bimaculoides]|uniref:serine-rich adhesin for platelets-like n=1 Tax=Octopus bimaculoides TaxID=37653 RepID=UPI0022E0B48A
MPFDYQAALIIVNEVSTELDGTSEDVEPEEEFASKIPLKWFKRKKRSVDGTLILQNSTDAAVNSSILQTVTPVGNELSSIGTTEDVTADHEENYQSISLDLATRKLNVTTNTNSVNNYEITSLPFDSSSIDLEVNASINQGMNSTASTHRESIKLRTTSTTPTLEESSISFKFSYGLSPQTTPQSKPESSSSEIFLTESRAHQNISAPDIYSSEHSTVYSSKRSNSSNIEDEFIDATSTELSSFTADATVSMGNSYKMHSSTGFSDSVTTAIAIDTRNDVVNSTVNDLESVSLTKSTSSPQTASVSTIAQDSPTLQTNDEVAISPHYETNENSLKTITYSSTVIGTSVDNGSNDITSTFQNIPTANAYAASFTENNNPLTTTSVSDIANNINKKTALIGIPSEFYTSTKLSTDGELTNESIFKSDEPHNWTVSSPTETANTQAEFTPISPQNTNPTNILVSVSVNHINVATSPTISKASVTPLELETTTVHLPDKSITSSSQTESNDSVITLTSQLTHNSLTESKLTESTTESLTENKLTESTTEIIISDKTSETPIYSSEIGSTSMENIFMTDDNILIKTDDSNDILTRDSMWLTSTNLNGDSSTNGVSLHKDIGFQSTQTLEATKELTYDKSTVQTTPAYKTEIDLTATTSPDLGVKYDPNTAKTETESATVLETATIKLIGNSTFSLSDMETTDQVETTHTDEKSTALENALEMKTNTYSVLEVSTIQHQYVSSNGTTPTEGDNSTKTTNLDQRSNSVEFTSMHEHSSQQYNTFSNAETSHTLTTSSQLANVTTENQALYTTTPVNNVSFQTDLQTSAEITLEKKKATEIITAAKAATATTAAIVTKAAAEEATTETTVEVTPIGKTSAGVETEVTTMGTTMEETEVATLDSTTVVTSATKVVKEATTAASTNITTTTTATTTTVTEPLERASDMVETPAQAAITATESSIATTTAESVEIATAATRITEPPTAAVATTINTAATEPANATGEAPATASTTSVPINILSTVRTTITEPLDEATTIITEQSTPLSSSPVLTTTTATTTRLIETSPLTTAKTTTAKATSLVTHLLKSAATTELRPPPQPDSTTCNTTAIRTELTSATRLEPTMPDATTAAEPRPETGVTAADTQVTTTILETKADPDPQPQSATTTTATTTLAIAGDLQTTATTLAVAATTLLATATDAQTTAKATLAIAASTILAAAAAEDTQPIETTLATIAEPQSTTAEPQSTTAEPQSTTAEPQSTTA